MIELTPAEIATLLEEELVGRIGCHADGLTYVVPVIYAYDSGSVYVLSTEGQKVEMMRSNPEVCFEVDRYEGPGRWRSSWRRAATRSWTRRVSSARRHCCRRGWRSVPGRDGAVASAVGPRDRRFQDPARRRDRTGRHA